MKDRLKYVVELEAEVDLVIIFACSIFVSRMMEHGASGKAGFAAV